MATQSLVFVVLPNGVKDANTLSLSIYLTPHLTGGATLGAFPDVLKWVPSIKQKGLKFTLTCGASTVTVPANVNVLRSDLWNHLFSSNTFVEPFSVPAYDQRLIVSYPARDALAYLKFAYQWVGAGLASTNRDERGLPWLLEELIFRQKTTSTLAEVLSAFRVTLYQEQQSGAGSALGAKLAMAVAPPDGVPTSTSKPADTADTIKRFALFHNIPPAPHRPPLPTNFSKTLDFHAALTALNSYPTLLRALGLVFDVQVPAAFAPTSPAAGAYGTIAVSQVLPGFPTTGAPQYSFPSTAYYRDTKLFTAAPATTPAALATQNYSSGDVVGGLLALSPQAFNLLGVDLDGALLQALVLADNVANLSSNFPEAYASTIDNTLPALRSGGIGFVASGRGAQLLAAIQSNQAFNNAVTSQTAFPRSFNATDLVRGYRLDVWDSQTKGWHSLHRRNATYTFPGGSVAPITQAEEGFLQTAAAQPAEDPTRPVDQTALANGVPQPGTDIFIHERVARWDGWSLSAPRPGKALNRSPDPRKALDADPTVGKPVTPFKMTTAFTAATGSLPELRFGRQYQMRVRAVDLAGNSISAGAVSTTPFNLPANGATFPHLRYEPVGAPIVVLRQVPAAGGSLLQLVIRSLNASPALDTQATTSVDQRHIAPPSTSVRMVEQLGNLDDAQGKLSAAAYPLLVARDNFALPLSNPSDPNSPPLVPGPTLNVGYLPDPLARGAALRALPNAETNTYGSILNNKLTYGVLPDVQGNTDSVTFIDFGTSWPGRLAFRLTLSEGNSAPKWDANNRVLSVYLQKGATVTVPLSSYLTPPDLDIMGVWSWMREWFEATQLNDMANFGSSAGALVAYAGDSAALITRAVLEGAHPMITPALTLTLTHAVQQPLGLPAFVQLPVVHDKSAPIFASGLRNDFTPITAWRQVGSHTATLLGGLFINGQSTAKIDLQAQVLEVTDDTSLPHAPTTSWTSVHVDTLDLSDLSGTQPIYSDALKTRAVAQYIAAVDTLWFAAPFDTLDGVTTPSVVAAPLHRFDDTKHRWVSYTPIATSRYQEYFDPTLSFTRTGESLLVDVPSSARPTVPAIAYVVPTFGWERQESTNVKTSARLGFGLRVYLERPWYSSGDNELLGVVLWQGGTADPDYPTRDVYKALFTQWGYDPIWPVSGFMGNVPAIGDFPQAVVQGSALVVEETSAVMFDVAGHAVQFDEARGLWYCDIELTNTGAYTPFVRLALARYQPHSITGVELSRVALADYAQLAPDRSAMISIDPSDPRRARVLVGGVAPSGPTQSVITVSVEQQNPKVLTDLGWAAAPASAVQVTEDAPPPVQPASVLWAGTIVFAKRPSPGQFRVVIRELEQLPVDGPDGTTDTGSRLVYAAIIAYDYPQPP
jgi:hypothetical protein